MESASSAATSRSCSRNSAGDELHSVDLADPLRNGVVDDYDRRRGAGQDRRELVVRQAVVDGNEREAGEAGAEQQRRDDVGVDVDETDPLDAARGRPGPDPPGSVEQVRVRHAAGAGPEGDAVAEPFAGHLEQRRQVHRALSPTTAAAWRP